MVTLTEQATDAIRTLTHQPEAPAGAGMRIAADAEHSNRLAMRLQPAPADGDAVVESGGARLFLDPVAAATLEDKALDAHADDDGQFQFTVEEPFH